MSTTHFDPTDHPRSGDGKFATKTCTDADPDVTLDGEDDDRFLAIIRSGDHLGVVDLRSLDHEDLRRLLIDAGEHGDTDLVSTISDLLNPDFSNPPIEAPSGMDERWGETFVRLGETWRDVAGRVESESGWTVDSFDMDGPDDYVAAQIYLTAPSGTSFVMYDSMGDLDMASAFGRDSEARELLDHHYSLCRDLFNAADSFGGEFGNYGAQHLLSQTHGSS
jgi:hypothetical protein